MLLRAADEKKIFIPEDVHSIQWDIKNIALNFAYERKNKNIQIEQEQIIWRK